MTTTAAGTASPPLLEDESRRAEGWAIASMVLGIVGIFLFTPVPGIVGLIGAHWAKRGGKRTAAIVLGWVQIALAILIVVMVVVILGAAHTAISSAESRSSASADSASTSREQVPSDAAPTSESASAPAGMLIVGGIDVDSICNARYLASHPDDNTSADEAAHNPAREGWLPGQTNLYADDPEAHNDVKSTVRMLHGIGPADVPESARRLPRAI